MRILLLLLSLLCSSIAFARTLQLPAPENTVSEITDYSEPVRFLIELKTPPIIELKNKNIFSLQAVSQMKNEQNLVRDALLKLEDISVLSEFQFVFNGFEIKTYQHKINDIGKIPSVKRVVRSKEIILPITPAEDEDSGILLNESVELIGAKALHEQNIRGEGKTIAILDTGIDANHPAFSSPNKILAKFNVINGGIDVKDGHGHGTHVAGIAAGNGGEITGVAPDAKLVVVKVLTDQGGGTEGWIIAGMEYIADLDQNPSTYDPVDVANMSLGSPVAGDPDDPMSQAVDRLSDYGVIFAIAAGNNGYTGIASPGVAKNAITVGATTKSDLIAQFSSVGPVEKTGFLKPEITAPGVNIKSSFPNNGYKQWNGTSMAAPHVAGAVALLKQIHPEWKVNEIKMALMATAKNFQNLSSLAQGWGRIQLQKAADTDFSISNSFIYLGTFFELSGSKTVTTEITYANKTNNIQKLSLKTKNQIAGISINIPAEVEIQPNSVKTIPIEVTVNQSELSFPQGDRMFYEPNIEIVTHNNVINFPIYLQRGIPIKILKGAGSISISKLGSTFFRTFISHNAPELSLALSPGKYIFSYTGYPFNYKEFYFIRKEFEVSASSGREINLRPDQAKYKITIDHRDLSGEPCKKVHPSIGVYQEWKHNEYSFSASNTIGFFPDTSIVYLFEGDYKFSLTSRCIRQKEFSIIARAAAPVSKDEVIETPTNMIPVKARVAPYLQGPKFWISDMQCHFYGCLGSLIYPGTLTDYDTLWFDGNEMNLRWYAVKDKKYIYDSLSYYVDKSGIAHFGFLGNFYRHVPLKSYNFGFPPISWQGVFENRANIIRFRNADHLMNPFIFIDSAGFMNYRFDSGSVASFQLKRPDGSVKDGELRYAIDSDNSYAYLIQTDPGIQELTLYAPHIDGVYGPVDFSVTTTMDTATADPNPPGIKNLEILYNGSPAYEIDKGGVASIQFEAGDYESNAALRIFVAVKPTTEVQWETIPVSNVGSTYTSVWQPAVNGLYDIKIEATDGNNNRTEIKQVGGIYVN